MNCTMKNLLARSAGILALVLIAQTAAAAVVLNELYTGGGSSQTIAAYKTDYIELFNNGPTEVPIGGFKINYAPSGRAEGVYDVVVGTIPAEAVLPAGGFYLIQTGSSGTGGANDPTPNADFNTGASLSNTSGSLKLTDAADAVLDIVGWGALTNNNFEGAPTLQPASVAISLQRFPNGTDTNSNTLNFIQAIPTPGAINDVPEPAALGLAAIAAILAARRRH
jgi:MYXO-CTERM domain-containing protein